jgi:hypothetical protein
MDITEEPFVPPLLFLKDDRASTPITVKAATPDDDEAFGGESSEHKDWYEERNGGH